jgi:hypothetical protein
MILRTKADNSKKIGNIFQGKKGQSIILMIIAVIVVTLVIFMTNAKALSFAKSDPVIKYTIANDIALMVNALLIPGDVVVEYPKDLSGYNLILTSSKVSVHKTDEAFITRVEIPFILPESYSAIGDIEGKKEVCLRKKNKIISLEECNA